MSEQKKSIEELLRGMLTLAPTRDSVSDFKRVLENSAETWRRIGEGTWAEGLDFSDESEKAKFLQKWIQENPYNNI